MIKTPGNLQDLNQKISGMGKAEAVGEGGVGPDDVVRVESIPDLLGLIIFAAKRTGERSAGNRHAPFDVAGAGNGTFQGLPHQSSTLLMWRELETGPRTHLPVTAPVPDPTKSRPATLLHSSADASHPSCRRSSVRQVSRPTRVGHS